MKRNIFHLCTEYLLTKDPEAIRRRNTGLSCQRPKGGTLLKAAVCKKPLVYSALLLLLFSAGCECFLPGGKPPEGNIIKDNNSTAAETAMDSAHAVDFFINELIRETMLHCAGQKIYADSDTLSAAATAHIIRKTGEFSGISAAASRNGSCCLISRRTENSWMLQLLAPDGRMIWQHKVKLNAASKH